MSERIKYGEMACGHLAGDTRCQCLRLKEMVKALEAENAKLRAVVEATCAFVGKDNIGKTVDTSLKWDGAISAAFTGSALHNLMTALKALETTNG